MSSRPPLPPPKLALFLSSPSPCSAGRRPANSFASGKHRLVCSCSAAAVVELEPGRGGALLSMAAARPWPSSSVSLTFLLMCALTVAVVRPNCHGRAQLYQFPALTAVVRPNPSLSQWGEEVVGEEGEEDMEQRNWRSSCNVERPQ